MKTLQSYLLVRFSVVSFVIIFVIALVIGFILTDKLNTEIELLNDHGNAMTQGMPMEMSDPYSIPNLAENVKQLKWVTGVAFTVGFLVLYVGLVSTVWRGWKTISAQRSQLETFNFDLEQQVIARTAELEGTIAELEAFSYAVSHDLRAPLRSINGFGQALYEDYSGQMDDQAKEYLQKVRSSTQKMEQLIDGL